MDNRRSHESLIVFSPSMAIQLEDQFRLPGTSVGARRIRASNKTVLSVLRNEKRLRKQRHFHVAEDKHLEQQDQEEDGEGDEVGRLQKQFGEQEDESYKDNKHHSMDKETQISNSIHQCETAMDTLTDVRSINMNTVTYKVIDENGLERRMTTKEKKDLKKIMKLQQKAGKNVDSASCTVTLSPNNKQTPSVQMHNEQNMEVMFTGSKKRKYHQLTVDEQSIKAEIDQIRGERQGVIPVVFSSPLALQWKIQCNHLSASVAPTATITSELVASECIPDKNIAMKEYVYIDDELAASWATLLQENMKPAEFLRSKEALRPMAYTLVPEVWSRMRPSVPIANKFPHLISIQDTSCTSPSQSSIVEPSSLSLAAKKSPWFFIDTRPASAKLCQSSYDRNASIIYHCLYNYFGSCGADDSQQMESINMSSLTPFESNSDESKNNGHHGNTKPLSLSCGAKFGCDYLLYDGDRQNRHAFAGLRILEKNSDSPSSRHQNDSAQGSACSDRDLKQELPIPTPYDMAGYVRGLNTAGKLALIATVVTKVHNDHQPNGFESKEDRTNHHSHIESQNKCGGFLVHHVVFVDLALEKILTAPTHLKKMSRKMKNCTRYEGDAKFPAARKAMGLSLDRR